MYDVDNITTVLIVLAVMLFMLLAVAGLIIIDHKSKIQSLSDEAFGPAEIRRNHPLFSFIITFVLMVIILALLFELTVALGSRIGLFQEKVQPSLVKKMAELRFTEKNAISITNLKTILSTRVRRRFVFIVMGIILISLCQWFDPCLTCTPSLSVA